MGTQTNDPARYSGHGLRGPARTRRLWSTGQIADLCGVSPRVVMKWIDSGRLKGFRLPGSQDRRVPREQLVRFLKDHTLPLGELGDGYTVLLVGADQPVADRLRELLSAGEGYRVELAQNGFEAGTLALTLRPDTVVIDLGLGRSEGCQVARHLRASPAGPALVVGLAGEDEADPDSLKGCGFDDVLKRPFDAALLAEKIRAATTVAV